MHSERKGRFPVSDVPRRFESQKIAGKVMLTLLWAEHLCGALSTPVESREGEGATVVVSLAFLARPRSRASFKTKKQNQTKPWVVYCVPVTVSSAAAREALLK